MAVSRQGPRSIATIFSPLAASSCARIEPVHPNPTITTSVAGSLRALPALRYRIQPILRILLNQRVPGSSPGAPTTHSLKLCSLQGTRNTAAVSKTCAPSFLTSAVSAHELAANNPIFAPRLRVENSRSRLGSETSSMTAWWAASSISTVCTTQSPETRK